jgi:acetyl esterase/lipase
MPGNDRSAGPSGTRRLIRAGVPTQLHVIPGAFHGFAAGGSAPLVEACTRWRRDALARAFKT